MAGTIDLFIIGAQKAGTTSLKNYLGEHPQVITHESQEFSFFYDDKAFHNKEDDFFAKSLRVGNDNERRFIAKHAHLYSSQKGIQRLFDHNPKCKLVYLIRNPVERAYSSYLMEKLYNRVDFSFSDIIKMLDKKSSLSMEPWQKEAILDFGCYDVYLKNIYSVFPREQIRLIMFEDFKLNPLKICQEIFSDLNIMSDFYPRVRVIHNESSVPRSKLFSRFIKNYIIRENNMKKLFSRIIPNPLQIKVGNFLRDINRSKNRKQKIDSYEINVLKEYYSESINKLESISGMDLSKWK